MTTCPDCASADTKPIDWGTDMMSKVLQQHYPDAHECVACGFGWSPAREAEKQRMREMGFRLLRPSTPPATE